MNICKSNNLIILNGRCGKNKNIGKYSFRNISVIDYAISSYEGARHVKNFEITEPDPLFSDGYVLLTVSIPCTKPKIKNPVYKTQKKHKKFLDDEKKANFKINMDQNKINENLNTLQTFQENIELLDNKM